jgi:hypothetical protein
VIPAGSAVLAWLMLGVPSAIDSPPDTSSGRGFDPPAPAFYPERTSMPAGEQRPGRGRERDTDPHGWYLPDFAKLQTGGFVGLLTVGTGYGIFDDVINLAVHYGYTPSARAGHDVHVVHLTLDIRPIDLRFGDVRWLPAYLGGGLLHVWGDQYFSDVPDRYATIDGSYYPPTALHWTAHLGTEIDWLPSAGFFERHGFYYELTTIDTFAFAYFENRETVRLTEALSSTFGYRAAW